MVICAKVEEEKRLFICALWAFWLFNSYQAHLFQLQSGWCRWYDVVPYWQESFKLISSRQSWLPRCFNEYRPSCFSSHHLAQEDRGQGSPVSTTLWSLHLRRRPLPSVSSILSPQVLPKKASCCRDEKQPTASSQGCWTGRNRGHLKVVSWERNQCGFQSDQCRDWISTCSDWWHKLVIFRSETQTATLVVWRVRENEFQKNVSAYCLSFRVKGSECVCSLQQVYSGRRFSNHGVPAAWAQGLPRKINSNIGNYCYNYYMMMMVIMKCFFIRRRERSSHCERSSMSCVSFVRVILSTSLPRCVFLESHFGWKEFTIWLVYLIFTHAHVPSAFRLWILFCKSEAKLSLILMTLS